jgi:hypothetical protein
MVDRGEGQKNGGTFNIQHSTFNIECERGTPFRLLAQRQPPSRRSGAMARREGGRTGALQDASRFSGIIVSRAASWTAAALRRFSQRHKGQKNGGTFNIQHSTSNVRGERHFVCLHSASRRRAEAALWRAAKAEGLAHSKTLRVFQESSCRAQRLGLRRPSAAFSRGIRARKTGEHPTSNIEHRM